MTKIHRLSHADFALIRPVAKANGRFFTLSISRASDKRTRFACVVSKKSANRAHERNLIKRRCRSLARELDLKASYTYVFTAKPTAKTAEFSEIAADVQGLFVKASAGLNGTPELQ